jgi:uncharacterized protein (TIGR03067 family)
MVPFSTPFSTSRTMNNLILGIVAFSLSVLTTVSAGDQRAAFKINGSWRATAGLAEGKKLPPEEYEKNVQVLVFKDGKYTETMNGKETEAGSYKIDATKNPHTIDFMVNKGKEKGKIQLGLIKIEGDVMTMVLAEHGSKVRPENFEGVNDFEVMILKRNK